VEELEFDDAAVSIEVLAIVLCAKASNPRRIAPFREAEGLGRKDRDVKRPPFLPSRTLDL
jgi:hypothetical protein